MSNLSVISNRQNVKTTTIVDLTDDRNGKSDYLDKCRSCLTNLGVVDIFKFVVNNVSISTLIKNCTNEEVHVGLEGLPTQVCNVCLLKFCEINIFIDKFKKTQKQLLTELRISEENNQSKVDLFANSHDDVVQCAPENDFKIEYETLAPVFDEICELLVENKRQLLRSNFVSKQKHQDETSAALESEPAEKKPADPEEIPISTTNDSNSQSDEELNSAAEQSIAFGLMKHCTLLGNVTIVQENGIMKIETIALPESEPDESLNNFIHSTYDDLSVRKGHAKSTDPENPDIQCFVCLETFPTSVDLRRHSKKTGHQIIPSFKCDICSKVYKERYHFKRHQRSHLTSNYVVCEVCGVRLTQCSYKRHILRHENVNFICPHCGKSFTQKGVLDNHIKEIHLQTVTIRKLCHLCGYVARNLSFLRRHFKTFHSESVLEDLPFTCEQCDARFSNEKSVQLHVKVVHSRSVAHTCGAKKSRNYRKPPVKCTICNKFFSYAYYFVHKRIHMNLRLYQCEVCCKNFRQRIHLKAHMNTHSDEKKYKCPHCEKSFRQWESLKVHRRSHTGEETPHVCSICHAKFNYLASLKKHLKKHHQYKA